MNDGVRMRSADQELLDSNESNQIEIDLLLEAIFRKYGYDFRNYAKATLNRRLSHLMEITGMSSYSEMTHRLLFDQAFFEIVFEELTINVTEMFRDVEFYKILRQEVIPELRTWPSLKIWVAGCATGEEVYSLAILLKEEELYHRSQIYATDINKTALLKASQGIYPIEKMKQYTQNYHRSGGGDSFSKYYTAQFGGALIDSSLKSNILFSAHNLVTDSAFNQMHLICCRNVMIYFDSELQKKVVRLFSNSLLPSGFLGLGKNERLLDLEESRFKTRFNSDVKFYQIQREHGK